MNAGKPVRRNNPLVTWSGNPQVEWLTDIEQWKLLEDITATWHRPGYEGRQVTAKAGFVFDGSSIPKRLQGFISAHGKHFRPSVFHDELYSRKDPKWTRKEADLFFRDGLETDGMPWHDRVLMHSAVRLFGGRLWG